MRRKTRNALVVVILLLASVPLLLKGAMYLRARMALDDLADRLSPDTGLQYGGIETDLAGAVSVTGLEIRPRGFDLPITVERVRVRTGDFWSFIWPAGWDGTGEGGIPRQLGIVVQSMRVPLQKAVFDAIRERNRALLAAGRETPAACDSLGFGAEELKAMGFRELMVDLDLGYRFDIPNEVLELAMDLDFRKIESLSMKVRLEGIVPEDLASGRVASGARLAGAELGVRMERDFGQRFVRYCAARKEMSPAEFLEGRKLAMRENLKRAGITLGPGLQRALDEYLESWGEVRLRLAPAEPIAPLRLMSLKPEQMPGVLGLSLFVNDRPVRDLDIGLDLKQLAEARGPARDAGEAGTPPARAPRRVRIVRRFRTVPVAGLDRYLGQVVRLHVAGQPAREGMLVAIADGEAQVEQRAHGGKVTSYVPLEKIQSLEVMREERKPLE